MIVYTGKINTGIYNTYCNGYLTDTATNEMRKRKLSQYDFKFSPDEVLHSVLELCSNDKKSFYGKAKLINTNKGAYLLSYDTVVCGMFPNSSTGEMCDFRKYWDGYSVTTMRHINAFLTYFCMPGMNKKQWEWLDTV